MLEITGLDVSFEGRPILKNLSLTLAPGLHIVIGPNGSGKTSLIRAIAGLVAPDRGDIHWKGQDVLALPAQKRANVLSYLAQNPMVHWPLHVDALVRLGRNSHKETRIITDRAVKKAMQRCQVTAFAKRTISQLSGGERARVLLARALSVEAELLLVDEPTAALDPAFQLQMMQILADTAKRGVCVLCVVHDLPLAVRFADQLILLDAGNITAKGLPGPVLRSSALQQAFGLEMDANGHLVV